VLWKDRCRIAEEEKLSPVEYPFLGRRKVLHTEEAWSFPEAPLVDSGAGAGETAGIELQVDRESFTADFAMLDQIERGVSSGELRPGPLLFSKKLK